LFINKFLSKNQIIHVIFEHPKLMQRPIFISENKAIIANPPEESLKIL
ncbi:MAG: arsenate reductase (glutaredoxin), partial [Flavobacteriaceae bacterium]|nr:arsenate reductase (glutaredoxin) [Flavobacteriaceae bacterium]